MSEPQISQYEPQNIEKKWYDFWLKENIFRADENSKAPKYSLIMPPPNVTGVLHMGHALMATIEDILVRWKRMQGFNTLWLPGTDHAGIATQMVVERNLQKEKNLSKHDLGREKFLEKVWEWKELSQGTILSQMKLIGCSADWSRLAFTLDENVSKAVRECFVRLYNEKLIYRQEAMIQWCPRCRTALSDLEVKAKELKGSIWQIHYVLKGNPKEKITVATTRPETLLADVAIAVNPDDERYAKWIGKTVLVPLLGREIPVIADSYVDAKFGTGALKITPGHDQNDFAVAGRHKLPFLNLFDDRAVINEVGGPYQGLTREKGREKILADLTAAGLLGKEEKHVNNVGHCDRCSTIVEPKLSFQWFVNAEELAKEAIRVVEDKEIKIVPVEWEKTYFEWMRNIRPWCISRQLWWGHRIPAWHCGDCKKITVATEAPKACSHCKSAKLSQDEDVLDTWFSSGLWPISTLGWPNDTQDLKTFYPTDVMETGFDILFFWVARMIMMGIKMTGKIPFHTIYLHPMVRDEYGQKMSKTKGNVKDPLEIIGTMGADALRFTLASMAVHGRDVLLSDSRIEGYRNFGNKIWNANRFINLHFGEVKKTNIDTKDPINQWILSRLNTLTDEMNRALTEFRFYDAANLVYHFVWSEYCDWFIEFIKEKDELEKRKKNQDSTAIEVMEACLRMLHPFMPFITEELWQGLPLRGKEKSISIAKYPMPSKDREFPVAAKKVGRVIRVVDALRSKRGENNVNPSQTITVAITADKTITAELLPFSDLIQRLVRASDLKITTDAVSKDAKVIIPLEDCEILVPRGEMIQVEEEKKRVAKELEGTKGELERAIQKLGNAKFTDSAPADVVQGVKDRKVVLEKKVESLEAYLKEL